MTRKTTIFFVCLALCSMVLFGLLPSTAANLPEAVTAPFLLLADGLRQLSLSGTAGNVMAMVVYTVICLLPLLGLLRKERRGEDFLLVLASMLLFYALYAMINPGLPNSIMATAFGPVILVGLFCSILLTWGCLKLLRKVQDGSLSFYGVLRILLPLCAGLWIIAGFGLGVLHCKTKILAVQAGNTMPGLDLVPTYLFLVVSFLLNAAEYSLDALLLLYGASLVTALEQEPYGEAACQLAEKMAKLSRFSLLFLLIGSLVFNLFQLFFFHVLFQVQATIEIPLFSLCLMAGILALAKLLQHGRQLKEDNELFI